MSGSSPTATSRRRRRRDPRRAGGAGPSGPAPLRSARPGGMDDRGGALPFDEPSIGPGTGPRASTLDDAPLPCEAGRATAAVLHAEHASQRALKAQLHGIGAAGSRARHDLVELSSVAGRTQVRCPRRPPRRACPPLLGLPASPLPPLHCRAAHLPRTTVAATPIAPCGPRPPHALPSTATGDCCTTSQPRMGRDRPAHAVDRAGAREAARDPLRADRRGGRVSRLAPCAARCARVRRLRLRRAGPLQRRLGHRRPGVG